MKMRLAKNSDQEKAPEPQPGKAEAASREERVEAPSPVDEKGIAHRVLVRPHVTEKAGRLGALNQYVFRVAPRATKQEIKRAVAEVYGVRPVRVATVRVPGKRRRLGRSEGTISGYRKAVVTLPQGKTIEVLPK